MRDIERWLPEQSTFPSARFSLAKHLSLCLAALVVFSVVGCNNQEGSAPTFVLEDSAGVVVATNTGSVWAQGEEWSVSDQPVVVMGGSTVGEELLHVADYVRAEDGTTVVLAAGLREVRVFDSDGNSVGLIGRVGQGPGEFSLPMSLALTAMKSRSFYSTVHGSNQSP